MRYSIICTLLLATHVSFAGIFDMIDRRSPTKKCADHIDKIANPTNRELDACSKITLEQNTQCVRLIPQVNLSENAIKACGYVNTDLAIESLQKLRRAGFVIQFDLINMMSFVDRTNEADCISILSQRVPIRNIDILSCLNDSFATVMARKTKISISK